MIPAIPLVGGLIGALASTPLGTTVARGILGGVVTGVVADVVMKRQQRQQQSAAQWRALERQRKQDLMSRRGGLLLPDGQPVNPPATPGELSQQQMVDEYIRQRQGAASEVPGQCVVGPGGGAFCGNSLDLGPIIGGTNVRGNMTEEEWSKVVASLLQPIG